MTKMMKKVMVTMVMLVAVLAISAAPAQAATRRTTKLQMNIKQTKVLKFTKKKLPKKAKVSWTSSNKNVVAVNRNGKVIAKRPGTAKIMARYGKNKYVYVINVKKAAKKASTAPVKKMSSSINKASDRLYRVEKTIYYTDGRVESTIYYYYK